MEYRMGLKLLGFVSLLLFNTITAQETIPAPTGNPSVGGATTNVDSLGRLTTRVTTSQCDAHNECQCTIESPEPCAADVQYAALLKAREQLNQVYGLLDGNVLNEIKTNLAGLVARMTTLEGSLYNQSISVSMKELSSLQDQVSVIQGSLTKLAASSNNTVTQQLRAEVDLISNELLQLGAKNPLAVKEDLDKEIVRLKARLASCSTVTSNHKDGELRFVGDGLPANYSIDSGTCSSSINITIGKPVSYKLRSGVNGMWFKDPLPPNEVEKTRIYEIRDRAKSGTYLYFWKDLDQYERTDFERFDKRSKCPINNYGQKIVILRGSLYWYQLYSGRTAVYQIYKQDVFKSPVCSTPEAKTAVSFTHNGFNYLSSSPIYVDINFDETGLYAVYPNHNGELEIARLNQETLAIEQKWNTGKKKSSVSNVFMVCGRLYTTDDYRARHLNGKQWVYDTNTQQEYFIDLDVESKYGQVEALSYNPRERALFGWDNGHAVLYPVYT